MAKRKIEQVQTVRDYLNGLTIDELRKLGRHLPANMPTRKGDLVDTIYAGLMTGDGLQRLWTQLDELQRAAVAEVVHSPSNHFDPDAFRAKYGSNPHWGAKESWGGIKNPSALNLFFYNRVMPTDLKVALHAFVPKPRNVELKTVATLPEQAPLIRPKWQSRQNPNEESVDLTVRETQRMAQHDLLAVLRLIETGQVRATAKTQRPTAATIRIVAEGLEGGDYYAPPDPDKEKDTFGPTEPDYMRAFAWPLLVQSGGLAEVAGAKLQLTSAGKKALTAPPHQTLRALWKSWLKTTLLDEFNRVKKIRGQTGQGAQSMTAPSGRRKVIAEALAQLPVNEWVAFDEFSRYMQAAGYTFTISRDLWTLYIEDANYGNLGYAGFGDWHIVQARYLLVFLMEYAATLGLLDIAYTPPAYARYDFGNLWGADDYDSLSDHDGLRYLRLNNLGAWVLGLANSYQPPIIQEQKLFNVLPNREIVVTGPLPVSDRLLLERFAQQTADHVWQLDPAKLLEAHEAGLSVTEVRQFLEAKAITALPQTITVLLQEMSDKIAKVTSVAAAYLIAVSDPQTAQLLVHDNRLAKYCLPAGDQHVVVPAQSLSAFRRLLHELGYALPQVEG